MVSGSSNINYFPENQLTTFSALLTFWKHQVLLAHSMSLYNRAASVVCPSVRPSVNFCANRFFSQANGRIVTKLAHDGLQVSVHAGCAQGQGQGQRSRDTDTFVLARKSLLLAGKWPDDAVGPATIATPIPWSGTWTGRRALALTRPRLDADSDDRPWNQVRESGSRWWLDRRRQRGGVSNVNTVGDVQRQASQRRNSSGTYGKGRPRRDTVTRGGDTSRTSVRRLLRRTLVSTATLVDGSTSARPAQKLQRPLHSVGHTLRQLQRRLLLWLLSFTTEQLSYSSSVPNTLCLGSSR